jgi:hypothetical protein
MADNLIPQHKRLACGDDIDTAQIESPFKQVANVDKSDGKKPAMSDGARKRTTQRYD